MTDRRTRAVPAAVLAVALSVLAAACNGGVATTTTVTSTSLATTTTTTMGRIELEANGAPFLQEGDAGAYVQALQFYLVCTGHERLIADGPAVTVDGNFGPITADAVAYYQAELRRIPSGDPDEETFAQLARDCREERSVAFPDRQGDDGGGGQRRARRRRDHRPGGGRREGCITIVVTEGEIQAALETTDGTRVQQISPGGGMVGEAAHRRRVPPAGDGGRGRFLPFDIGVARPRFVNIDFGNMRLAADGFGILSLGDDAERVIAALQAILGDPGRGLPGGLPATRAVAVCPGSNRHLTWVIQPAEEGDSTRRCCTCTSATSTPGRRRLPSTPTSPSTRRRSMPAPWTCRPRAG